MPAAGSVSAQVLTFPYHLVAIPKAEVKDVKFEKDAKSAPPTGALQHSNLF